MHKLMLALSSTVVLLALALSACEQNGQEGQKGLDAYNRGDYTTALRVWMPLAEAGDADAQQRVGAMYSNGHPGVPRDIVEAARWYRPAAEQGHAHAQFWLGHMYKSGDGAAQDYTEAARWYLLAAEQGHARAQFMIGAMYGNGEGVPQDHVQALMWLDLASARGIRLADTVRPIIAGRMTPADILEAERLAQEWEEAHQ